MGKDRLTETELDRLLSRSSRTRPVDRAALDDENVGVALDATWRHIRSDRAQASPVRLLAWTRARRRWVTAGFAAAGVGVASLIGVETLTGGGGAGLPLAVSPAAAAELQRVARAAGEQTGPVPGQWEYIFTDNVVTQPITAAGTTVTFTSKNSTQTWYAPDGTERLRTTNDGGSFATSLDEAKYQAHKSAFDRVFAHGDPTVPAGVVGDFLVGPHNGSPASWHTFSTSDPQTLVSEITAAARPSLRNPAALWVALLHILSSSASPEARSTTFAALSYVHGTKVVGRETDQLGRSGTAISFENPPEHSVSTLIVAPETGEILEDDETFANSHMSVVQRETFTQQSVVDSDTALPGGGTVPLPAGSKPITTASTTPVGPTSTATSTATAPLTSASTPTSSTSPTSTAPQ